MVTVFQPTPLKSDNYSRKPLPPHPSADATPRHDPRGSVPPRRVRLLIGQVVLHEQDVPFF